jgi:hypothetical protein
MGRSLWQVSANDRLRADPTDTITHDSRKGRQAHRSQISPSSENRCQLTDHPSAPGIEGSLLFPLDDSRVTYPRSNGPVRGSNRMRTDPMSLRERPNFVCATLATPIYPTRPCRVLLLQTNSTVGTFLNHSGILCGSKKVSTPSIRPLMWLHASVNHLTPHTRLSSTVVSARMG